VLSDLERQIGSGKGTASGEISSKQGHIFLENGILIRTNVPPQAWTYLTTHGLRFAYANFTRNFLLIRRNVFATVRWDEDLLIQGEHLTFMLDLQKAGWLLAFTPESVHLHNEEGEDIPNGYSAFRHSVEGRNRRDAVFRKKFGILSEGREMLISPAKQKPKNHRNMLDSAANLLRKVLQRRGPGTTLRS